MDAFYPPHFPSFTKPEYDESTGYIFSGFQKIHGFKNILQKIHFIPLYGGFPAYSTLGFLKGKDQVVCIHHPAEIIILSQPLPALPFS